MFEVEYGIFNREFPTYEEAERFCAEHGIHPENIYDFTNDC